MDKPVQPQTGARRAGTARRPRPRRVLAPWLDRAGRFSWLKAVTLVLLCLPIIHVVYAAFSIEIEGRPVLEAIHRAGDWGIRFLLLSLAITPARRILEWNRLILVRRMIGIAALAYLLTHFFLYIVDSAFNLRFVATEIALRIYLTIGFVALLGLCALGITSTDAMVRRLGKRWNTLHQLVYPIAVLGLIHFFMQSKLNVSDAVFATGLFYLMMGYRLMRRFNVPTGTPGLLALAMVAALLTVATEFAWYGLMTRINPARILYANLNFPTQIRPSWLVLAAGLAVVILQLARRILPIGRGGQGTGARNKHLIGAVRDTGS
jgi:sulfoxide reductase heme-binding subunit YedZ